MVLKLYSLQGRYATALFNVAKKTNKVKDVELEMTRIKSFISKSSDMKAFLENPSIARDKKKSVVENMLVKQKYSETVINLFRVLADYGRLDQASKVIVAFEEIMKDYNSEVQVRVVSQQALSEDVKTRLEAIVQKKFISKDKKSNITWEVNDKIMGGLIIEAGDNVIDLSVASKAAVITKDLMRSI